MEDGMTREKLLTTLGSAIGQYKIPAAALE